jgi:hypothetical protein
MEIGKRYWVRWVLLGAYDNSQAGVFLGECPSGLGWGEFDVFKFDGDGDGKTYVRRDRIQYFEDAR